MVRMTKLKQGLDTVKYLSLIEDIDTAYTLRSLLNTRIELLKLQILKKKP